MAAPGGKYFIQDNIKKVAAHHESWEQLWNTKWKMPATMGVYPFMFGAAKDFEPILAKMKEQNLKEPYNWDTYPDNFFPKAEELENLAIEAEKAGEKEKACEYYLRSSAVYRISRFPAPRSDRQREAWTKGKEVVLKGLKLKGEVGGFSPVHEVKVPHKHGLEHEGKEIPVFYQIPDSASNDKPAPCVIIFTGLDGYRTELVVWAEGWRRNGVAVVILEIPGTGDSTADPKDITSPDRQYSSLLDWLDSEEKIDSKKLCVWAFSTGGYYAIRLAHTHPDRLAGVVALGGGAHHMFDPEWLDEVNHLEYPFDLANTLAYKWGYGDDIETFKKEASDKFSLLKNGTLDKPNCARLLLVNGTEDEIFPIDDYYLALQHGAPKEARFVPGIKHMGEPESFFIIMKWIYNLFGLQANPGAQMSTLPFKAAFP
ncbi:Arylacetonitrilase [Venturia inaequalis]|nr:Arylacetonitrilase [Venturia inaequalis]